MSSTRALGLACLWAALAAPGLRAQEPHLDADELAAQLVDGHQRTALAPDLLETF